MWSKTSLLRFQSPLHPQFQLFYTPLRPKEQQEWADIHHEYRTPYAFLCDVLSEQIYLVEEVWGTMVYRYTWPVEGNMQNHLFGHLPESLIMELGSRIMGIPYVPISNNALIHATYCNLSWE